MNDTLTHQIGFIMQTHPQCILRFTWEPNVQALRVTLADYKTHNGISRLLPVEEFEMPSKNEVLQGILSEMVHALEVME
jgi:hypothetical protein